MGRIPLGILGKCGMCVKHLGKQGESMKRSFLTVILGVSMLVISEANALYLPPDRVIRTNDWADAELHRAYETGLVDTSYMLGNDYMVQISREQLAHLIVDLVIKAENTSLEGMAQTLGVCAADPDAAEWQPPQVTDGSFSDTQDLYVELAARMGIVQGFEGRFLPQEPVMRAEAAVMLYRCMQRFGAVDANQKPSVFSDYAAVPDWAQEAVKFVSGRITPEGRLVMGGAEGKFEPLAFSTIEEMILSIGRVYASLSVPQTYPEWRHVPEYERVTLALTFGGDCTFGRHRTSGYANSFDEMYAKCGPAYFFSGIPHFFDDDLTMVNFEGTLTDATRYANKAFVFKGPQAYADILRHGSIDMVTVANNHSYDYLEKGFQDTVRHLQSRVQVSGYDAMPIVNVKGVNIGFASNVGWTFDANQKRFIEQAIASLKNRGADLIVFNYHWGIEGSYRHNATQEAIAHYCIDQGADLVIGHHPHVPQEVETYKGKQIAYSLGNLVFGGNRNPKEKRCLIFRQNFTFDLVSRSVVDRSYQALPYRISSVTSRNDYHPVPLG